MTKVCKRFTFRLTSKALVRQICRDLGLNPGDTVVLEPATMDGKRVWVLKTRPVRARAWAGSLSLYGAKTTDHSMRAIRNSIAIGRAKERLK